MDISAWFKGLEEKSWHLVTHEFGLYSVTGAIIFAILYIRMLFVSLTVAKATHEIHGAERVDAINKQREDQLRQQAAVLKEQADHLNRLSVNDDWNKV